MHDDDNPIELARYITKRGVALQSRFTVLRSPLACPALSISNTLAQLMRYGIIVVQPE